MSKFWKVVIIIGLILGAMVLLTFLVPDITKFASGLATKTKLPIWLVGFAAPILYALSKFKDMLGGVLGESGTEKDIRERNDAIKAKLLELEKDVQSLDQWRRSEMDRRLTKIDQFNTAIAEMESREKTLDQSINGLRERRKQLSSNGIREDDGAIE